MDSLTVLKVQELTQKCTKHFKERTITKKNASENILLDSDFNYLLDLLLSEENECAFNLVFEFMECLLKDRLLSIPAFVSLIQQKLTKGSPSKCQLIIKLNILSAVVVDIESKLGLDISVSLSESDSRTIPFILKYKLCSSSDQLTYFNFLLGDPDLLNSLNLVDDCHYKLSRCQLLSYLTQTFESDESAVLLTTYLTWNSGKQCVQEFTYISPVLKYFTSKKSISSNHSVFFNVYIEVLCELFFKQFSFGDIIQKICQDCPHMISEYSAFMLASLLMLSKNVDSEVALAILILLRNCERLNDLSKICCANILLKCKISDELLNCIKDIFSCTSACPSVKDHVLTNFETPITEFGLLATLGYTKIRPIHSTYDRYFTHLDVCESFSNFHEIDNGRFFVLENFELLFSLFSYKWNTENDKSSIVSSFLKLLQIDHKESLDSKIMIYSWVVDFFDSNFSDEMYLQYLPLICKHVSSSDNVLYKFVQKKISFFMARKSDLISQLPCTLSLYLLFESSQSRQSRLEFLCTMSLSFLQFASSNDIPHIDTRAFLLSFHLLCKLCDIHVIDPKHVWVSYVQERIIENMFYFNNSIIRAAVFRFASTLHNVAEGVNDEINTTKLIAIQLLLQHLSEENDSLVLDNICFSLSKFDPLIIKRVELELSKQGHDHVESSDISYHESKICDSSIIFNPKLLFEVLKRFPSGPSVNYLRLWTTLANFEVSRMSRSLFLGNNGQAKMKNLEPVKPIICPQFCNSLIFEEFRGLEFSDISDIMKFIKVNFIPIVPVIGSLSWYIRPHLPKYMIESVSRILRTVEDQGMRLKLSNFDFLLQNLRVGSSPQSLCSLVVTISSIFKSLFLSHDISANQLLSGWVRLLSCQFSEIPEFKAICGNEEFLSSCAVSSNILSGCSEEIDACLINYLDSSIISNPKLKDGFGVYSAIEAFSILSPALLEQILYDSNISSKRRLVSLLCLKRCRRTVYFEKLVESSSNDNIITVIKMIAEPSYTSSIKVIPDPLEFKGLFAFAQSLSNPVAIKENSKSRAFESGNIPSALKFDSLFGFLLGSGFNILNLCLDSTESIDFVCLEKSTKDSKCLSLLQLASQNQSQTLDFDNDSKSLARFDKNSWIKFISSSQDDNFKFNILQQCDLLPRIDWGLVSFAHFKFILKHVLSVTPVTKTPHINSSMLKLFFEYIFDYYTQNYSDIDIFRICDIMFSCSADTSSLALSKLFSYTVSITTLDNIEKLKIFILAIIQQPTEYSKDIEIASLKNIESNIKATISDDLGKLMIHLSKSPESIGILFTNDKSSFEMFKESLRTTDSEMRNMLINFLIAKISQFGPNVKVQAIIDILDLIFVYQNDIVEFKILKSALQDLLSHCLLIECRLQLLECAVIDKIKSRRSLIPTQIMDIFDIFFNSAEYDKLAF